MSGLTCTWRDISWAALAMLGIIACGASCAGETNTQAPIPAQGPFKPEWDSLKTHQDPEWFRDAKFGIYTHWGPITVATENAPAMMEWYGRELYLPNHPAFKYHQKKFGDQKTVGYKDVIPHFTADKFNAEEWADLFERAGAKFAGPVAIHHDHFANWDSKVTRWNSGAMGPKRDLTGELEKALRKHGLKFMTSFHHGFAWRYYEPAYAYDAGDPQYADLYGEPHEKDAPPSLRFLNTWLALVDEVLGKYHPDLIWFDFELGTVITPEYQRRMFADAYNAASSAGSEIAVTHKHPEIHQHTGILDFERGREEKLVSYPWLTDTSIGPWFHHSIAKYRPTNEIVDMLVDIVSKNGCLLLNVGPQADGRIPDKAKEMLIAMGDWLRVNGEAIYGTRPWTIYGEGPTNFKGGAFSEEKNHRQYTAKDIRFTTKDGALYAITLDWPKNGKLTITSLASGRDRGNISKVTLLGRDEKLKWKRTTKGLTVTLPKEKPCEHAFSLKIEGEGLRTGE